VLTKSELANYHITGKCAMEKSDNSKFHNSKSNFSVLRLQIHEILLDYFSYD
jgi:hypothetical protein